jgi:hypothetical protein
MMQTGLRSSVFADGTKGLEQIVAEGIHQRVNQGRWRKFP